PRPGRDLSHADGARRRSGGPAAQAGVRMSLAALAAATLLAASPAEAELPAAVAALPRPSAVYLEGRCLPQGRGAAAGLADADAGRAMTVDTPLRIASNTKTFTAATALRLWEQSRLDLEAPVAGLIAPELDALLRERGYAADGITVRHLLTHSAGLYDHGSDPRFTQTLFGDPKRRWSREDLVRLSM